MNKTFLFRIAILYVVYASRTTGTSGDSAHTKSAKLRQDWILGKNLEGELVIG